MDGTRTRRTRRVFLGVVWVFAALVSSQNSSGPPSSSSSPSPSSSPSSSSSSSSFYVVSSPQVIFSSSPFRLAVTVFSDFDGRLAAQLTHGNIKVQQRGDFRGGVTSIITLPPISISLGAEPLPPSVTVTAFRGNVLLFSNTSSLSFSVRNVSSFIQTDRSEYRPGDSVRVRVASVRLDRRPYAGRVEVAVQDPSGAVVQRWGSAGRLGVTSRGFVLSQNAAAGRWTVTASAHGVTDGRAFTVGRHERPPFDLLVQTPSRVVAGDGVGGSVRAVHPDGRPVRGTAVVSLSVDPRGDVSRVRLTRTLELYGSAQFSFLEDELQSLSGSIEEEGEEEGEGEEEEEEGGRVLLGVGVADAASGLWVNKTVTVRRMENRFRLRFHGNPTRLKPALTFSTNVSVSRSDGRSLSSADRDHVIHVDVTQSLAAGGVASRQSFSLPPPQDGNAHISFPLEDRVQTLLLQVRFQSAEETLTLHNLHPSPSGSYLHISPLHSLPAQIGFPFHVNVESSFQLSKLHYVVSSGSGGVLAAGSEDSSSLSLTASLSWTPAVCLTVYCVRPGGEIAIDTLHVPVQQHSDFSLRWSSAESQPGEQVFLSLADLDPDSAVGVTVWGTQGDTPLPHPDRNVKPEYNLKMLTNAKLSQETPQDPSEWNGPTMQEYWNTGTDSLLWFDAEVSDGTWRSEALTVPDGVTSLRAASLVMSEGLGLRFTSEPQTLSVSRHFSVSLDVPPTLVRGEEVVLEVFVSNHLERDIDVVVLLAQSQSFQFVLSGRNDVAVINAQKLSVGSHRSATARFPIRTLTLGQVEVEVDAVSSEASESLVRTITVKSAGVQRVSSQTLFLELEPETNSSSASVAFSFPPDVEPGSQTAHVALAGDILSLSIARLGSLVRLPLGCGEQNLVRFAPSVYVLHYLNQSMQSDPEIRTAALRHMTESYNKQLSYRRDDGSFSPFGDSDASGSTWLTSFVLRCLLQARSFLQTDQRVVGGAWAWLLARQRPGGDFEEAGRLIHSEMRGGEEGSDPVALTAYVLLALLEDGTLACIGNAGFEGVLPANLTLAVTYLENSVSGGGGGVGGVANYSLSLAAYALALAGSPAADEALAELDRRADYQDGAKIWTTSGVTSHDQRPTSAQIEVASYVLLALLSRGGFVEGIPLMKWLSRQLSPLGGFRTTQDTVVALQALVCYAVYSGADTIKMKLSVSSPAAAAAAASVFYIDSSNYRVRQSREISADEDLRLNISMEGKGFAVFQLNAFYNLRSESFSQSPSRRVAEAFLLLVDVSDGGDLDHMTVAVCMRLKRDQSLSRTGMVLLDVGVLGGFSLSPAASVTSELVRKVESGPESVSVYLDSLNTSQVCIQLPFVRKYKVAHVQPAVVTLHDYYQPSRMATATYSWELLQRSDSCVFCGSNCELCRPGVSISSSSSSSSSSSPPHPSISSLLLLTLSAALAAF